VRRARREGFDAFRVDHVVGFYRQHRDSRAGPRGFLPADEAARLKAPADRAPRRVRRRMRPRRRPFSVRRSRPGIAATALRWEDDAGVFHARAPIRCPSRAGDDTAVATWWRTPATDSGRA
jgi:hypothetical protein